MPPPEVEVVVVAPANATYTRDLPGRVQAFRTAQVRARVDGVIEARLFKEGSDVTEGTQLFRIDSRSYRAAAEAANADASLAYQNLDRAKRLLEIKAISQQEYDLTLAKAAQARAALVRASEDVINAGVPAPISGHIGRTEVTEGALVSKNAGTLLATVEQLDPVYVNFSQSAADLLRLRQAVATGVLKRAESTDVELMLEDGSVYTKTGRIFFTDLAVDANTGSVSLRAQFPNPKRELLPGMFVRLRFPEAMAENVIRIPQRAVQSGAQGQFVMVVGPDGKVGPRPVTTSGMAGADFVIASGLQPGDQVIVNGLQKARPGAVVKPVPLTATMKMESQLSAAK
ncbi:MAG: efflux RND transporter periplasmic adaptor subunit [Gammaproteobacteria bacterium]|nr:efflux RND transporter periplasmic adaptor subunit [Gammaproteobacteria bacterium]MBU1447915.1 efflux RND transporter periplasmic adaptor subunit [Gammaproteobacteria bacterium]